MFLKLTLLSCLFALIILLGLYLDSQSNTLRRKHEKGWWDTGLLRMENCRDRCSSAGGFTCGGRGNQTITCCRSKSDCYRERSYWHQFEICREEINVTGQFVRSYRDMTKDTRVCSTNQTNVIPPNWVPVDPRTFTIPGK